MHDARFVASIPSNSDAIEPSFLARSMKPAGTRRKTLRFEGVLSLLQIRQLTGSSLTDIQKRTWDIETATQKGSSETGAWVPAKGDRRGRYSATFLGKAFNEIQKVYEIGTDYILPTSLNTYQS